MATQSIEDYIKAIFQIGDPDEAVQTSALADRLGVRPASVSNMMRRLDSLGLIRYEPYQGAVLTAEGQKLARRMVRRHRLIERFLTEVLEYPWEEVHEEAERLEHAVSPRFVEAIDRMMERPSTDPHGAPIPTREGKMDEARYPTLAELGSGAKGIVRRVRDNDPDLLRYFRDVGIRPQRDIEVLASGSADEPLTVLIAGKQQRIGKRAAGGVFVEVINDSNRSNTTG